jgi:D-xylose reductase
VKREDLFIVSKLWNTFHDSDKVEPICRKQLADWGVDYFDLYIVHFPVALKYVDPSHRYPPSWFGDDGQVEYSKAPIQETWTAMESLVDNGLARSIGISNFDVQLVMDVLRYARIPPATLQIEHHPYLTQPGLVDYAKEHGITVTAYSSFGPASFDEFDFKISKGLTTLFQHDAVKSIAQKHGKTPAQVLLRWATQRGIAVIPKSGSPARLAENLDVTSFDLESSDIETLSGLDKNLRFNNPVNVSFFLFSYSCTTLSPNLTDHSL